MRTKLTLILLLLNVAVAAWIYYSEKEARLDREKQILARRVFGPEVVGLTQLELNSPGAGNVFTVRRSKPAGPWLLTAPVEWAANDFAINRIVQDLQFLENESSFAVRDLAANGRSLADYGLDFEQPLPAGAPPRLELVLSRAPLEGDQTGGSLPALTTRLRLGATTGTGDRLFVLSPDGSRIHVVGRGLLDSLRVGMEQLLSTELFNIPVYEIRALSLQTSGPRIRLRREGETNWLFESPIATRASKSATQLTLLGLHALRVQRFVNGAEAAPERTGLETPDVRLTLEGNNRREILLVGRLVTPPASGTSGNSATAPNPATPGAAPVNGKASTAEYFARMEDRRQVFITALPSDLLERLRSAQDSLREPRLLDFDPASVTAITLSAPSQTEELTLQRLEAPASASPDAPAAWQLIRRPLAPLVATAATAPAPATILPADATVVDLLLQRLSVLSATKRPGPDGRLVSGFLRDAPSDAELENLGFNRPEREITLTFGTRSQPPAPSTVTSTSANGTSPATTLTTVPAPIANGGVQSAPTKLTLQLATGTPAGQVQARVSGQSFIYGVPASTLGDFPVAARVYRDRNLRTLPEGTRITGLRLAALPTTTDTLAPAAPAPALSASDAPAIYTRQLAADETWALALAVEPAARRGALEAVLNEARFLKVKQFISNSFSETVTIAGETRPWAYRLDLTLTHTGGAETRASTSTLFLAARSGGTTQIAGSPDADLNAVFELPQPFIDALWTLLYGDRDPGPPPAVGPPSTESALPAPVEAGGSTRN